VTHHRNPVEDVGLLQLLQAMPTAALLTDPDERIVYLNPAFERLTGYSLAELSGRNCRVLQSPETDPGTIRAMRTALSGGARFSGEVLNVRRNGEPFWNALMINPVRDRSGELVGFVSSQTEVTEQVAQRRGVADRLLTAEILLGGLRRFTSPDPAEVERAVCDIAVEAGAPAAALVRMRDGRPHVVATSGTDVAVLGDDPVRHVLDAVEDSTVVPEGLHWVIASDDAPDRALRTLGVDRVAVLPVVPRSAARAALIAIWTADSDVARSPSVGARMQRLAELIALALDNVELIERIRSAARVDDLTGLASRPAVQSLLEDALSASAPAAVLYLDVDRFKRVNDSLGHAAGDELLMQIARRIDGAVGSRGAVGRLGGDEFLVVLPDADERAALAMDERIASAMRRPFDVSDRTVYASVSVGRAVGLPARHEGVADAATRLVQTADAAMYAVKQRTRAHHHPDTRLDLLALEADLHGALGRDEISTWFQPQYEGGSGRIAGFEALARWRHPSLGWIGPSVFIPLAEEAGLIAEVGARVLRDTVRFAEAHAERLGPLAMSVNTTRAELLDEDYAGWIEALLARRRSSAWTLTVEVTELELEEEDDALREALAALRRLGVGVAIDHFGSGSSSLRMLQDLPVTAVKIDEAFFRRSGALGERMIGAIVARGHGLGLEGMAEGIETGPQLEALRRLGCGRLQGYLLAPPGPSGTAARAAADLDAAVRITQEERSAV
jgi:diguanylate cyclase (GGDEF)-like protein/PAS domain S-box-containing protein